VTAPHIPPQETSHHRWKTLEWEAANDDSPTQLHREIRRLRVLDAIAAAMIALALWSVVGIVVALRLDAVDAAWDFWWALAGSAVTLIAVAIYGGRAE
jgi:hypothetical protein